MILKQIGSLGKTQAQGGLLAKPRTSRELLCYFQFYADGFPQERAREVSSIIYVFNIWRGASKKVFCGLRTHR